MKTMIGQLKMKYDIVLLDAPAMLVVTDAAALIPRVNSVILVIRRAFARQEAIREACKQLAEVNAHLTGIVINQVEHDHGYYNSYYRTQPHPE
jgi:Mrp family chromosome partitioning ATPase